MNRIHDSCSNKVSGNKQFELHLKTSIILLTAKKLNEYAACEVGHGIISMPVKQL